MRRRVNAILALVVSTLVMVFLATGYGPLPPLGVALGPGGGVWDSARDTGVTGSRTVLLDGMREPATVVFDADGIPTVRAASDYDLFLVQGYLQASFRLTQLDLQRRTARGRLAELQGPGAVEFDTFELQAGLLRTAQATWATMSADSAEAQALTAYSQGVNNRLAELRRDGGWPALFALTGVYPQDWTPVDSLAVQGLLTQMLSYTTAPLDYALLSDSLGPDRTMAWFPVIPPNEQQPYDPGPYRDLGVSPLAADANANAAVPHDAASGPGGPKASSTPPAQTDSTGPSAKAAADLLGRVQRLPASQIHSFPDSNAWAANGPAVVGGRSMLAGDPHLPLSLPSVWYQMALSAPSTEASGASLVGLPGIVIGQNRHISWSLTNVQNQSTFFYVERTSADRPGQYFWQGAWRDMTQVSYTIPVRGAAPVSLTVELTVHGPVMTQAGQTTSVYWTGNLPSHSLAAIIAVDKAGSYQEFREALRSWHAPTLNFVYADDRGDIGITAAGYFPLVKTGDPWLPLPGSGESDISGTIPFDAAPQVYNPPGHVVVTANQRPVTADYPYYIGTSRNAYENGYRADQIYRTLEGRQGMAESDFAALQNDVTDYLSTLIVPRLLAALRADRQDALQQKAMDVLAGWDDRMTVPSAGASIWWTFWSAYLHEVFDPWWNAAKVPVDQDREALEISAGQTSLVENLETWTLRDPGNPAFSPPGKPPGDAAGAMRAAFAQTVADLRAKLGDDPASWSWGRLHTRQIPALTQADALGYGPDPAEGDFWTVNAAERGMTSSYGPSWRMVVDWTSEGTATARAVYPGGQSENPLSPWYRSFVSDWWDGRLRPMPLPGDLPGSGPVWTLRPEG